MSEELICITCPLGCHLEAERRPDGSLVVTGNRCPRGPAYAREELLAPRRVVTATCRARVSGAEPGPGGRANGAPPRSDLATARPRRIPCRTRAPFPKERVGELLVAIYSLEVELPVEIGKVLIPDALGSGIDLIATRSIQ
jgi:CxxC motif-containing protein